jgi:hypothetical protein
VSEAHLLRPGLLLQTRISIFGLAVRATRKRWRSIENFTATTLPAAIWKGNENPRCDKIRRDETFSASRDAGGAPCSGAAT